LWSNRSSFLSFRFGAPSARLSSNRPHLSQVDDYSPIRNAVICAAVATAANRQLQSAFASEIYDAGHIVRLRHPHDERWPSIETAEERRPRTFVVGITGHDYSSLEVRLKVLNSLHVTNDWSMSANSSVSRINL